MGNYLYIDGITLWLVMLIVLFLSVCIVLWGMDYVKLIRKLDRLQVKYNNCRADLSAAQMELKGLVLRQAYGQSGTPVPTKEIATPTARNDIEGAVKDG